MDKKQTKKIEPKTAPPTQGLPDFSWYIIPKRGKERTTNSSGVDVKITIFCDFRQFSAKKLAFF
jgi:hypothetical protein